MKYGKEIAIFGQKYEIKIKKRVVMDGEEVSGKVEFAKHRITLSSTYGKKHQFKTFFHEIIHCIIHEVSLTEVLKHETEEIICDTIAKGFVKCWEHLTEINH